VNIIIIINDIYMAQVRNKCSKCAKNGANRPSSILAFSPLRLLRPLRRGQALRALR